MLRRHFFLLMDQKGDGDGGGGAGSGEGAGQKGDKGDKPDPKDTEIADIKAKLAKYESKKDDEDLSDKSRRDREARDKASSDVKAMESAVLFNTGSKEFLKENDALLPSAVKDLFATADKETFDSPMQKANQIKAGIIQEFFQVQANNEHLTQGQKNALADYLKLTKNGKEEKAQAIYESIFEPTLKMLRTIKKHEDVSRARNGYNTNDDDAYKKRLIEGSRKHYLGEKN